MRLSIDKKITLLLKEFIKEAFSRFGLVVFKRSSRVYLPEEDSFKIIASLCDRSDPVMIDGGAHLGGAVEAFGSLLPDTTFFCFEPDPILGQVLTGKFARNLRVTVVQAALGEHEGKAEFNINASRPTNSLLPASESLNAELQQLCQPVEKIVVALTTIDDYTRVNNIGRVDIIKLDLQGYDFLALKGAKETLRQAKIAHIEVLFREIYTGCHLFPDIVRLMTENGFTLYTLCGMHYGEAGELLWADAIFAKACKR